MSNQAVDRAIEIAGGQLKLAKAIGSAQQTISFWKTKAAAKVPAERCVAIEAATGVLRQELRPDIFGPPPSGEGRTKPTRSAA